MALIFNKTAPSDVVTIARATLADLANVPDGRGGREPLAECFVSDVPLAVYSLSLDSLAHGGELRDAKAVAWRVIVVDGQDEPVGTADMAPSAGGHPSHFLGYARGPQVISAGKALSDATTTRVAQGRYEPRFLEVPGISTTALWLKNLDGGLDRIIPLDPVPRFLRDRQAYTPSEFLDRVRTQVTRRLQFDETPL
jgi:hypothetical protein